jgi:hypothetical protein
MIEPGVPDWRADQISKRKTKMKCEKSQAEPESARCERGAAKKAKSPTEVVDSLCMANANLFQARNNLKLTENK